MEHYSWRTPQISRSRNSNFEHKPQGSTPTIVPAQVKHDNWCRLNKKISAGPAAPRKSSHCTEFRFHSQWFSHVSDTDLRTWRKVLPLRRPPDYSVVQAVASRPRHFRAHQTQSALLQADAAFASVLRYRGLSAHGVRRSGTASRHTLLPQVCLDTVFQEGHFRSRDVLLGLAPPRGSLGGNAVFTSRCSVWVQWMTSSTFSL